MTYVDAFRLKQASLVQITEMIDSVIERRDSEQGFVPAQVGLANEIQADSRILMVNKVVRSTQRDVGMGFRVPTTTSAIVGSYGRATNSEYTNDASEMRAIENMDNSKILSHFLRKDLPSGKTRLCLTGSYHALMAVSSEINGNYPLLVDITASYDREQGTTGQDFDESRGSIDIGPSIEVARKKMAHILKHYKTIFLDGQDVLKNVLEYARDYGDWIAHELNDEDMEKIDPKFGRIRDEHGTYSYAHVILLRNLVTGDTILVYAVWQMASSIGSVSTNILLLTAYIVL